MQKFVMITVTAIAMIATVSIGMVSADGGKKVDIKGLETFEPNALSLSNLRFAPENIKVDRGDTVTWADNALTTSPHTVTIVDPEDLPANFAEAYTCLMDDIIPGVTFDGFCLPFLKAHGGLAGSTPVVNVGRQGLDVPGDSLFLAGGGSVSAQITAAAGRVLHYMCIIHPWMQGSITVEEKRKK